MPDEADQALETLPGVTRSLLTWSLGALLGLMSLVYTLYVQRISALEDRVIRAEAIIANRGERIALLESGRAVGEAYIRALEARVSTVESHLAAVDVSLASHRAATERGR